MQNDSKLFLYIRDYFFPLMNIDQTEEISINFLNAVGTNNKDEMIRLYPTLEKFVIVNKKDSKNVYFNRMRFYLNDEFGFTFNYAHV